MSSIKNSMKTIIKLGVSAVAALQVLNMYTKKEADEHNVLKDDKGSYYRANNCDVFYKSILNGHEEAVLLLHDSEPSCSGYEFKALAAELMNNYDVYILDLPGCGRSEKLNITYTNYFYVQILNGFIQDIVNRPVKLVTSGLTGSFAVTTAACHADLVSSITMINPVSLKQLSAVPERNSKILRGLLTLPVIGTSIYNILYAKKNIEYKLDEKIFYNPFKIKPKTIEIKYSAAHLGNGRFLLASLDGKYLNWNITRQVKNLTIPVSILYGRETEDGALIARQYKKANNQIKIASVPSVKYQPHIEAPELLSNYI